MLECDAKLCTGIYATISLSKADACCYKVYVTLLKVAVRENYIHSFIEVLDNGIETMQVSY